MSISGQLQQMRALSRERNRRYRARLSPSQKKRKRQRDRVARECKKRERLHLNPHLFSDGKRICSRCFARKELSEFHSKGKDPANFNNICDTCLIRLYQTESHSPKVLTPVFWRKKAYSCNMGFIIRQRVRGDKHACISNLGMAKITGEDLCRKFEQQQHRCFYCGVSIADGKFQMDHRHPVNRGGKHGPDKIDLVCADCNNIKWDKSGAEFRVFLTNYAKRILGVVELRDKEPAR